MLILSGLPMKDSVKKGDYFVKFTFGEVSDFNHPVNTCFTQFLKYRNGNLKVPVWKNRNVFTVKGNSVQSEISGVRIPYKLSDGFYTIRFKHRSANPITVKFVERRRNGQYRCCRTALSNGYATLLQQIGCSKKKQFL